MEDELKSACENVVSCKLKTRNFCDKLKAFCNAIKLDVAECSSHLETCRSRLSHLITVVQATQEEASASMKLQQFLIFSYSKTHSSNLNHQQTFPFDSLSSQLLRKLLFWQMQLRNYSSLDFTSSFSTFSSMQATQNADQEVTHHETLPEICVDKSTHEFGSIDLAHAKMPMSQMYKTSTVYPISRDDQDLYSYLQNFNKVELQNIHSSYYSNVHVELWIILQQAQQQCDEILLEIDLLLASRESNISELHDLTHLLTALLSHIHTNRSQPASTTLSLSADTIALDLNNWHLLDNLELVCSPVVGPVISERHDVDQNSRSEMLVVPCNVVNAIPPVKLPSSIFDQSSSAKQNIPASSTSLFKNSHIFSIEKMEQWKKDSGNTFRQCLAKAKRLSQELEHARALRQAAYEKLNLT
jgi:hypothetical protein